MKVLASLKARRASKKLRTLIERTDKPALLEALWVVDRAANDPEFSNPRDYDYPAELFGAPHISSPHSIRGWEIETLATETLRWPRRPGPREGNPRAWAFIASLVSALRQLEDNQYGSDPNADIWREIFRIGHRQFPWQHWSPPQYARWWSIFRNEQLQRIFFERTGIALDAFVTVGLGWNVMFNKRPTTKVPVNDDIPNLSDDDFHLFAQHVSISLADGEKSARRIASTNSSVAYRQSVLRSHPIVKLGGAWFMRPIEKLLHWRITSGLYYDVIDDPQSRNHIGDEFEAYVCALMQAKFSCFNVQRAPSYGTKAKPREGPDVLVSKNTEIKLALECKATKVPLDVQTSFGSSESRQRVVKELAKGVVQLCSFKEDVQSGKTPPFRFGDGAILLVVTLDDWIFVGEELKAEVLEQANILAPERDIDPSTIEQSNLAFCTAAELEYLVSFYSDEDVLKIFQAAAAEESFFGYTLHGVANEKFQDRKQELGYPLPDLAADMLKRFLPGN